jgi:hypothetical protein
MSQSWAFGVGEEVSMTCQDYSLQKLIYWVAAVMVAVAFPGVIVWGPYLLYFMDMTRTVEILVKVWLCWVLADMAIILLLYFFSTRRKRKPQEEIYASAQSNGYYCHGSDHGKLLFLCGFNGAGPFRKT